MSDHGNGIDGCQVMREKAGPNRFSRCRSWAASRRGHPSWCRAGLFYPMLASQHYSYLLREIDLVLTGQLLADDKLAVAAYLAQLPAPGKAATSESPR